MCFRLKYSIEKSIIINTSLDTVWNNMINYSQKLKWSPWYVLDKDCERHSSGENLVEWFSEDRESKIIWVWDQVIISIEDKKYIEWKISFIEPYKSHATNKFSLEDLWENQIKITWIVESSLPLYLFFLKKSIVSILWMDINRWLTMLKWLSEEWSLETDTEFLWIKQLSWFYYIWITRTCDFSECPELMKKDYESLTTLFKEKKYDIDSEAVTIYKNTDLSNWTFTYTVCFPVSKEDYEKITLEPWDFEKWVTWDTSWLNVRHYWSYKYLWNSWTYAYMYAKAYWHDVDKKLSSFEVYLNNPNDVAEKDLITDIYLPVK